jgi:hypothetical protein
MKLNPVILLLSLAAPAFGAATGQVVGPGGTPVAGAQVCEFVDGSPVHCVTCDAQGVYRMDNPKRPTLLVRAQGFVPKTVDASPLPAPVALRAAATLKVTVVDAKSGTPLPSGRVRIDAPSGQRIGDFVPFNSAGVRISTLTPGPVFVRTEADGYDPGGPVPVELVGGSERVVRVAMTKSGERPR